MAVVGVGGLPKKPQATIKLWGARMKEGEIPTELGLPKKAGGTVGEVFNGSAERRELELVGGAVTGDILTCEAERGVKQGTLI